jgi:hypothetical protein
MLLPEAAGPHDPSSTTPPRRPGSIRRTSSIDTFRPNGILGDLDIIARARDLRTDRVDAATVVSEAELRLRLDGTTRAIRSLASVPVVDGLDSLIGMAVGPGFRAKLNEVVPDERVSGSLLYLLLDDLPGATLVSGYAMQRAGLFDEPEPPRSGPTGRPTALATAQLAAEDLCAGWARESAMMVTIRTKGVIPTPMGPPAPTLEPVDDPAAWHPMGALVAHAMRRRRRLDVLGPGDNTDEYGVDVHFRDSHVDAEGVETVLHEYSVDGSVDAVEGRVVDMVARAHVLPWTECPGALASAGRLAGMSLAGLRSQVRRELTGTSTCTHLNDMLRSLSDVPVLVSELVSAFPSGWEPDPVAGA